MRTAKMFWRDMCLGTFRHGARFLIIPLVVVLMTAGLRNMLQTYTMRGRLPEVEQQQIIICVLCRECISINSVPIRRS